MRLKQPFLKDLLPWELCEEKQKDFTAITELLLLHEVPLSLCSLFRGGFLFFLQNTFTNGHANPLYFVVTLRLYFPVIDTVSILAGHTGKTYKGTRSTVSTVAIGY